jgi:signal transduction histidine kinase
VLDRFAADVERRGRCTLTLDAAGPVVGRWDPDRLDQVLTNLVSNALKYSPEGGEVRVGVRRDDGEAALTVSDQGIGIPPAERATLFEPFARGAAARRIAEGTGLGLSIAATIVARHGGTIACESEVGVGSTFTVRLPLTPPDQ